MTSTTLPSSSSIFGTKTIVIDTTAPTVASFTTATASGYYNAGEAIVITANTSEAIQNLSLIPI